MLIEKYGAQHEIIRFCRDFIYSLHITETYDINIQSYINKMKYDLWTILHGCRRSIMSSRLCFSFFLFESSLQFIKSLYVDDYLFKNVVIVFMNCYKTKKKKFLRNNKRFFCIFLFYINVCSFSCFLFQIPRFFYLIIPRQSTIRSSSFYFICVFFTKILKDK